VFAKKAPVHTSETVETGFEQAESEKTKAKAPGGLTDGLAGALARTSEKVESAPKIEDPEAILEMHQAPMAAVVEAGDSGGDGGMWTWRHEDRRDGDGDIAQVWADGLETRLLVLESRLDAAEATGGQESPSRHWLGQRQRVRKPSRANVNEGPVSDERVGRLEARVGGIEEKLDQILTMLRLAPPGPPDLEVASAPPGPPPLEVESAPPGPPPLEVSSHALTKPAEGSAEDGEARHRSGQRQRVRRSSRSNVNEGP